MSDWLAYVDRDASTTPTEMMRQALSRMPADHPEVPTVRTLLDRMAARNAAALTEDVEKKAAEKAAAEAPPKPPKPPVWKHWDGDAIRDMLTGGWIRQDVADALTGQLKASAEGLERDRRRGKTTSDSVINLTATLDPEQAHSLELSYRQFESSRRTEAWDADTIEAVLRSGLVSERLAAKIRGQCNGGNGNQAALTIAETGEWVCAIDKFNAQRSQTGATPAEPLAVRKKDDGDGHVSEEEKARIRQKVLAKKKEAKEAMRAWEAVRAAPSGSPHDSDDDVPLSQRNQPAHKKQQKRKKKKKKEAAAALANGSFGVPLKAPAATGGATGGDAAERQRRFDLEAAKNVLREKIRSDPGNPKMDALASALLDPEAAPPDMRAFGEALTKEVNRRLREPEKPASPEALKHLPEPERRAKRGEATVRSAEAREGASGFRGAIEEAIGRLDASSGPSATILDFTVNEDGSLQIETTEEVGAPAEGELVARVKERLCERHGEHATVAVEPIEPAPGPTRKFTAPHQAIAALALRGAHSARRLQRAYRRHIWRRLTWSAAAIIQRTWVRFACARASTHFTSYFVVRDVPAAVRIQRRWRRWVDARKRRLVCARVLTGKSKHPQLPAGQPYFVPPFASASSVGWPLGLLATGPQDYYMDFDVANWADKLFFEMNKLAGDAPLSKGTGVAFLALVNLKRWRRGPRQATPDVPPIARLIDVQGLLRGKDVFGVRPNDGSLAGEMAAWADAIQVPLVERQSGKGEPNAFLDALDEIRLRVISMTELLKPVPGLGNPIANKVNFAHYMYRVLQYHLHNEDLTAEWVQQTLQGDAIAAMRRLDERAAKNKAGLEKIAAVARAELSANLWELVRFSDGPIAPRDLEFVGQLVERGVINVKCDIASFVRAATSVFDTDLQRLRPMAVRKMKVIGNLPDDGTRDWALYSYFVSEEGRAKLDHAAIRQILGEPKWHHDPLVKHAKYRLAGFDEYISEDRAVENAKAFANDRSISPERRAALIMAFYKRQVAATLSVLEATPAKMAEFKAYSKGEKRQFLREYVALERVLINIFRDPETFKSVLHGAIAASHGQIVARLGGRGRGRSQRRRALWRRVRAVVRVVGRFALLCRRLHEKAHRARAPRACKECAEARPRDAFTPSQWARPRGRRTCRPCQDAAAAKVRRDKEETDRKAAAALRDAECIICCAEMVPPEERAIFECAHWICKGCASELHKRNELAKRGCPYCRHPITDAAAHVAGA